MEEYEIYVGGLSWCTSERELEDAFSRYGKILDTRIIIERAAGRSRGFGFITFASRQGVDNAIREMNGQIFDQMIISVNKAKPKREGKFVEPGFSRGYLSGGGGRDSFSFRRGARSVGHDECFKCGCLGHWARDCPLVGGGRPSFSSRSWFERDGSEDSFGGDHYRYIDEQYDGGRHRVEDCLDSKHDKDGCYNYSPDIRVASIRGTSNTNSSCSHLDDCKVGNVTVRLTNKMHEPIEKCKNYSYSLEDPKRKSSSFQNEEGGGDSEASLSAINFSQENSRTMLATMVLLDELSFRLVESERFLKFCQSLQPKFVIPSRVTMIKDWFQIYLSERKCLKNVFTQNCQRVCLTIDTLTSVHAENYMVLTAHFIDNGWNLHRRILNFCQISNHEGETIGRTAEKCLLDWGINRLTTITVDNGSSNDAVISYLRKKFTAQDALVLNGEFLYVRCCVGVLMLFISDAWKNLDISRVQICSVVKNITSSPARLQTFREFAKENNLSIEDLSNLGVPTTWNSTDALETIMKFQKLLERIKDRDPKFFLEVTPSLENWESICAFVKLSMVVYEVISKISGSLCVTSNEYFHKLCLIQDFIRENSQNDNLKLSRMIPSIQANFNKYWGASKRTNFLLYVALVLDPRYKLKFLKYCFREFWEDDVADKMITKVKRTLQKMCDEYFFNMTRDELNNGITQTSQCMDIEVSAQSGSSRLSMAEKFRKVLDKETPNDCKIEVDNYLFESCHQTDDDDFDVLKWWKLNSSRFSILSQIAKDIFAIPFITASQSTFDTEARVLDRFQRSLPPKIIEAIICAQSWLQSKPLRVDVGDEIEDVDKIDQEFSKIATEMNLDSISD